MESLTKDHFCDLTFPLSASLLQETNALFLRYVNLKKIILGNQCLNISFEVMVYGWFVHDLHKVEVPAWAPVIVSYANQFHSKQTIFDHGLCSIPQTHNFNSIPVRKLLTRSNILAVDFTGISSKFYRLTCCRQFRKMYKAKSQSASGTYQNNIRLYSLHNLICFDRALCTFLYSVSMQSFVDVIVYEISIEYIACMHNVLQHQFNWRGRSNNATLSRRSLRNDTSRGCVISGRNSTVDIHRYIQCPRYNVLSMCFDNICLSSRDQIICVAICFADVTRSDRFTSRRCYVFLLHLLQIFQNSINIFY